MAWQPISTAPKDGTIIDLWHPFYGRICDCWWDDEGWIGSPEGVVTHWMPLPEPPEDAQ